MIVTVILQIDKMNYFGVCNMEEYERVGVEQSMIDSIRSGVDVNVIQLNNVKCLRMDREPPNEE
jgi:hypothetical protein